MGWRDVEFLIDRQPYLLSFGFVHRLGHRRSPVHLGGLLDNIANERADIVEGHGEIGAEHPQGALRHFGVRRVGRILHDGHAPRS
jgi:hypothetical protein